MNGKSNNFLSSLSLMRILSIIFFLLIIVFNNTIHAQNLKEIEKLKSDLKNTKNDTDRVLLLINISLNYSNSNFNSSFSYAKKAYELASEMNFVKGEIDALNAFADSYWYHSDYEKAQEFYFKAYRLNDSIKNEKGVAYSLYNIGWVSCIQQHQYKNDHYLYTSLNIFKKINDVSGLLKIHNALASYYSDRLVHENDKRFFDSSITYFKKGIDIARDAKFYDDLGRIYGNMGDLFYKQKDITSANYYNEMSYEIHKKTQDSTSMMICLMNKAIYGLEFDVIKKSISLFNIVYGYNVRHDLKDQQILILSGLAKAYYLLGDYKKAYDYLEQFADLKSSEDKKAFSSNINDFQNIYDLEKSEASVKQLMQTNEIQELKNKKNTYFIFILLAIALIVVVVALLLFKQNKQKQLTNFQLKEQNRIIAEKKLEIDQSIQYAKGIQQAVMPSIQELKNTIENSFVFYKPKDVVSGDFYWFGNVKDDFYCIVADCTGHGVPGALMSIIGIDKISQAIFEKNINSTGDILSFLNIEIKRVLKQHSDKSKQMDGMDIAVLKFNKSKFLIDYSGANRPLYLIRDKKLIEFKPDKISIGGFTPDNQVFATHSIPLQKHDSIYLFTDGYADQFGGIDGKKFMSKKMKEMFVQISASNSTEQKDIIEQTFDGWKRDFEQVDDVLIVGLNL